MVNDQNDGCRRFIMGPQHCSPETRWAMGAAPPFCQVGPGAMFHTSCLTPSNRRSTSVQRSAQARLRLVALTLSLGLPLAALGAQGGNASAPATQAGKPATDPM